MIIKIDKGAYCKGLINYNEKKVMEGEAVRLFSNMATDDSKFMIAQLNTIADLNKKTEKKFSHIMVSLPVGENLDNETFEQICKDYLKERGFDNCPHVAYRHFDKDHQHIHIVTSNINYEGKKINDYKDYETNMLICRELESNYNLTPTLSLGKENYQSKFNEYRYSNLLLKGINNGDADLIKMFDKVEKDVLKQMKNEDVLKYLNKNDNELDKLLIDKGLDYKTNKDKLVKEIDHLYKISSSKNDYFSNLENNGIAFRVIGENKNVIVYSKNDTHLNQKQISSKFNFSNINDFGKIDQKKILYYSLKSALKSSKSLDELKSNLDKRGITINYVENSKGGVTGASLVLKESRFENNYVFKASELDRKLSINHIKDTIDLNNLNSKENDNTEFSNNDFNNSNEDKSTINTNDVLPDKGLIDDGFDYEELQRKKRKRKYDKGMD